MKVGIIIKGIGGFYYIKSGDSIYECKARGLFRKQDITPLPGDNVEIEVDESAVLKGSIINILPRVSVLDRPAIANVEQIVTVISIAGPAPDMKLIDKLCVSAESKGLKIVICINKIDMDTGKEKQEEIKERFKGTGYKLIFTNANDGTGIEELRAILKNKISVFAGQSGVGKSTILNSLMGEETMKTGALSKKIDRGKHTTRHTQLIEIAEGFIADTPGFSSFSITDMATQNIDSFFPEFRPYLGECKYNTCSHIHEPKCAVKNAYEDKKISQSRYEAYIEIYNLVKSTNKKERGY